MMLLSMRNCSDILNGLDVLLLPHIFPPFWVTTKSRILIGNVFSSNIDKENPYRNIIFAS